MKGRVASLLGFVAAAFFFVIPVGAVAVLHQGAVFAPESLDAEVAYTSGVGSSNVNYIVGANRFYNAGYSGVGAKMSNIEAGHIDNTYSYLTHVTTLVHGGGALGTPQTHATYVGHIMGGRPLGNITAQGIAPNATLMSGAIATSFGSGGSFSITYNSFIFAYTNSIIGFGAVDVINSSWGGTDTTGSGFITVALDGLARNNPNTTFVIAAGNSGPSTGSVLGPASGYNGISVGALGNANAYNTVAGFSSRGPQDYHDPINGTTSGVRPVVDITAPGESLFAGDGTSYAAPAVAGAVGLMAGASYSLGLPSTSRDARVIKAVLMNAADSIPGWSNGQTAHPNGNGGVRTTQALDWNSGAGRMNLDRTFDQYLSGQRDIPGLTGGTTTHNIGWDFAEVQLGLSTDIVINHLLAGGTEFRVALTWFRNRDLDAVNGIAYDNAFANLNLEVWNSTFTTLYSDSISIYSETELLRFTLPATNYYGLRVTYPNNRFAFGTHNVEQFAIAWWGVSAEIVPEPGIFLLLLIGGAGIAVWRRRVE